MRWKYYIPHVWDSPHQRTVREDVWLLPEHGMTEGRSYWFTLNALTSEAAGMEGKYPDDSDQAVREMNLQLLGDRDYFITPVFDMVARVENFNMAELLEWTKLFIRVQFGDAEPVLVECDLEDFGGANRYVDEIRRIAAAIHSGMPEDEIIRYRQRTCDGEPGEDC
jgi:hypothetical protein